MFHMKPTNIQFATLANSTMSNKELPTSLHRVKESLLQYGIILHSDLKFPNLVRIVAAETVHSSWWGHPKADLIFRVGGRLFKDPDVLQTKLISGKDTYVHRSLWSYFLRIATSRDSWQLKGLSDSASLLLDRVESRGDLRTDEFAREVHSDVKSLGEAARQLERRLLVYGTNIHTQAGFHAKLLRSWGAWMQQVGFRPIQTTLVEATRLLESRVDSINHEYDAEGTLPWRSKSKRF